MERRLTSPGTRVLLIGTGSHNPRSGLHDIHSVQASLVDLKRALVDRCGLADDAVRIVFDPPGNVEFLDAVKDAVDHAEDVLWVHFIGHGLVYRGTLHLAVSGTISDELRGPASSVSYDGVRDALRDSGAATRVVTLDCCFSGLAISMASEEQETRLRKLTIVEHTYVMTATSGSQEAIAPADEAHTAFTGTLIRFLTEGDRAAGQRLTLADAHKFVSAALAERSMTPQLMEIGNGSESLILTKNPAYQPPRAKTADTSGPASPDPVECPYPGPRSFSAAEAPWFSGRGEAIDAAVTRLTASVGTHAPVVMRAAPGVGASSLLRAGLIPALDRQAPDVPEGRAVARHWLPVLVGLGPTGRAPDDPLRALAAPLAGLSPGTDPEELRQRILTRPSALAEFLLGILRGRFGDDPPHHARVVLIIDQCEEIHRLDEHDEARVAFVRALNAASNPSGTPPPALLLLAIHTGAPNPFGPSAPSAPSGAEANTAPAAQGEFTLPPLTGDSLREAIEHPARKVGADVSHDLARLLERDLDDATSQGRLPLLARALRAAWEHRDGRTLTYEAYHRSGGMGTAAAALAEDAYAALDAEERQAARLLLLRMVRIEDDATDGLRSVDLDELLSPAPQQAATRRAASLLARRHVMATTDTGSRLIHREILNWQRLRDWIEEDRLGLAAWQRLLARASDWERSGRDGGRLLTGGGLTDAVRWKGTHRELVTPLLDDFLHVSGQHHTTALRRRVAWLLVLVVLFAASAVYAFGQRANAISQRDIAESRRLAAAAAEERDSNPELAALLAVQAYSVARTPEAESSLLSTQAYLPAVRIAVGHGGLNGIAVTPDGRLFATADQDGRVSLGQVGTAHGITTLPARPHPAPVYALAFSPDGQHLAAAHSDGSVDLWTVGGGRGTLTATLPAGRDAVNAISFNSDGTLLATGGDDGTLRVWRTDGVLHSGQAATPVTHQRLGGGPIEAIAFAPQDPGFLLTGNADATATAVSLSGGGSGSGGGGDGAAPAPRGIRSIPCGTQPVDAVAISGDGTLATGDDDGEVRLWGRDGRSRAVLSTPATPVEALAFSKDGDTLAAGGADGGIRLWETRTGTPRGVLFGPSPQVRGLAFVARPTGTGTGTTGPRTGDTGTETLVGAGSGGTVGLWSVGTGQPDAGQPTEETADTAVFGPRGSNLLATVGTDGAIRLWHLHGTTPFYVIHTNTAAPAGSAGSAGAAASPSPSLGPVLTARIAFSPDGSQLAFVGSSGAVVVWDLKAQRERQTLSVSTSPPDGERATAVAYSPDGSMLVVAGSDRNLVVWNTADLNAPPRRATDTNQLSSLNAIAFRGDGILATASNDGTIDLMTIPPTLPLQNALHFTVGVGHLGPVEAIGFSPDGHTLASGGADLQTRLWSTGEQPKPGMPPAPQAITPVLPGHTQAVISVAFSPDGSLVASAGEDRTVMLWDSGGQHALRAILTGLSDASTAAFDPQDQILATSDSQGVATFWSTDPGAVIHQICADHPTFTPEEWSRFNPGRPFRTVCPR